LESKLESNLRVYIVIGAFHPLIGGAETQALAQCQNLLERGCETTVLTLRYSRTWLRRDEIEGIPVIRVAGALMDGREKLPRLFQRLLFPLAVIAIGWILWRHRARYDIVHVYSLGLLALISALSCRFTGKPLIIGVRGSSVGKDTTYSDSASLIAGPLDPTTPWLRINGRLRVGGDLESLERMGKFFVRCTRKLLRSVGAVIIVLSSHMRDYLDTHNFLLPDVMLIPNGVNVRRFTPVHPDTNVAEQEQVVVCVSRLSYEKGIDVLLQAWYLVHQQAPEAHLIIVGNGALREQLERMSQALGIETSVEFAGRQIDIPAQLHRGMLSILPSRVEGMPNALLEAMACGLACVATRVSGSEDIIQHGVNGLLVEPEDYEGMATALLLLLRNTDLVRQFGHAARCTIEQRYAIEHVTDMHLRLYQKLVFGVPGAGKQEKSESREYKIV
jgi:glycosyltransferase involved in cell wall biosynthesis